MIKFIRRFKVALVIILNKKIRSLDSMSILLGAMPGKPLAKITSESGSKRSVTFVVDMIRPRFNKTVKRESKKNKAGRWAGGKLFEGVKK